MNIKRIWKAKVNKRDLEGAQGSPASCCDLLDAATVQPLPIDIKHTQRRHLADMWGNIRSYFTSSASVCVDH